MNSKSSVNPFEEFGSGNSRLNEIERRQRQDFVQAVKDGRVRIGRLYARGDLPALRERYGITEEHMSLGLAETDQLTKDENRRLSGRTKASVLRYWIKEELITKHNQPQDTK